MPNTPREPTPEEKRLREAYDSAFEALKTAAASYAALPAKSYPPHPDHRKTWDDLINAIVDFEIAGTRIRASHEMGSLLAALNIPDYSTSMLEPLVHVAAIRRLAVLPAVQTDTSASVFTHEVHRKITDATRTDGDGQSGEETRK